MKKNDLIHGNIGKALLLFVLPLIAGSLIQQLYTTADAIIVGQFTGKNGLAAIDAVHTLFKFPINFMNGLAAGATIMISGYFGANNKKSLHCAIRTALLTAAVLGIICSLGGVYFTPHMLNVMSVPSDIYDASLIYCRIYFSGLWAMIFYNMLAGILRAFGDSRRPLYVLILSSIINIVGDFLLVGVFHTGVGGTATATVLAQIISAVVLYGILIKADCVNGKLHIFRHKICREHMGMMIKKGFPLALQSMLFPIANSIIQASVNTMGTNSIAAWGICDKLDMIIWLIADSMGPALTTYTAQNIGAGKFDRVKKGAFTGVGLSVVSVGTISLLLYFCSGVFGTWFIAKKDVPTLIPLVVKYMQMMAPFFIFYAVAEAFSGACCGLGETVTPMITTLITICLLRVVCIWTVLPSFSTMECIVWIYIASWIVAGGVFTLLYYIKVRKHPAASRQ